MKIISLKIDVSKIDKERLYKGEKGTYLDAVVKYSDKEDKYGNNGMITQQVSKEEREKGVNGNILGNAKLLAEFDDDKDSGNSDNDNGDVPF